MVRASGYRKQKIMKRTFFAAATLSLIATCAFAEGGATLDGSKISNSNGSLVGQSSSDYTGNGDVIGGNGTSITGDQTTAPASRPSLMQSYGVFNGKGNAGDNAGGVSNNGNGGSRGSH